MNTAKKQIETLLSKAGISINGPNDSDPKVFNEKLYDRILTGGTLALGESYMDAWWEVAALDKFFYKLIVADLGKELKLNWANVWMYVKTRATNIQSVARAKKVAQEHYDLDISLFESFLDPYNQYTCGYFKDTDDLNKAQEQKLDLICRKLNFTSQDRVLDIGCGWGGFAKYASEHYGCKVTGISISDEQVTYAKNYTKGLPVTIVKKDYRELGDEKFDKILSCGMFEHVGYKNYRTMMEIVNRCLTDDGLFLLHTMGLSESAILTEPWVDKYIFPNGRIPSLVQIAKAIEGVFVMEDWHNFGPYYDKTLMAWFHNFDAHWDQLKANYSDRFYRMWKYYLLFFAANFRARSFQLWQIVLSKHGIPEGYRSVR